MLLRHVAQAAVNQFIVQDAATVSLPKPAVTIPALEDAGASGAGSSGTETSGNTSSGTTAAGSAAAPADTNAAQPSAENNTGVTPPKTGEDPVTVVYLLLFASMIGMALVRRKKHFKDSF